MKSAQSGKTRGRAADGSRSAGSQADEACVALMELVKRYGYNGNALSRLTNLTFWAGSGFSRSWEPSAPLGDGLFTLGEGLFGADMAAALHDIFDIDPSGAVTPKELRQIVYQLDMYEKYPDLRSRYIDDQNIHMLTAALRNAVWKNFDRISRLNYIDADTGKFPLVRPSAAQHDILRFISYLRTRATGSGLITEGLRPQFVTTNYDFVIETILDHCEDADDTLFNYTYRGFTPRSIVPVPHRVMIHEHWLVQHLLKLNGGFEILPNSSAYSLHYGRRSDEAVADAPPVLILPSREQDYTDPYFRAVFPKTVRLMRDSTILVLVGYSLPEDDALVRFILRQFAEEQEDGLGKYIFYVDLADNAAKRRRLVEVFPWLDNPDAFPRIFLYEGGFAEFARECMSLVPA